MKRRTFLGTIAGGIAAVTGLVSGSKSKFIAPLGNKLTPLGFTPTEMTINFGMFVGESIPTFRAAQGSMYMQKTEDGNKVKAFVNSDGKCNWVAIG